MVLMPESCGKMEWLGPEETVKMGRYFSKSLSDQPSEWPRELPKRDPFEEHVELCVDIEIQKAKAEMASEIESAIMQKGQAVFESVKRNIRTLGYLGEGSGEFNLEITNFEVFHDSNAHSIESGKKTFHSRSASECLARVGEEVEKRMGSLRNRMLAYANSSLNQVYGRVLNTVEPMVVYNRKTYSQTSIVNKSSEINPNSGRVSLCPIAIKALSSEWSDEELEITDD